MSGAGLLLYRALLRLALPGTLLVLWLRDLLSGKSRPAFRRRMGRGVAPTSPGGVWIQAVSVGEVEVARRLAPELQRRAPGLPLLVTATTATGLALAGRTLGSQATIHPCPLDLGGPVRRVLEAVRPRLVVLVETELWPELLHRAGQRGIPVAVVNARLSDRSFARYHRVAGLIRPLLAPITRVLARSEADARRFRALGVPDERVVVIGNLKYELEADEEPLPWSGLVPGWADGRPLVVAGSTMDGEEAMLLRAVDALPNGWSRLFMVLAPRHPERFEAVARLLAERGLAFARRSNLGGAPERPQVLLLDTIGELARAYGLAHAAFLGGSLVPTGGHNPLEPAVWGVPTLSGPHVHNFREVYEELVAAGGTTLVNDVAELTGALDGWLSHAETASAAGERARSVVEANRGAAARTAEELLGLWQGA